MCYVICLKRLRTVKQKIIVCRHKSECESAQIVTKVCRVFFQKLERCPTPTHANDVTELFQTRLSCTISTPMFKCSVLILSTSLQHYHHHHCNITCCNKFQYFELYYFGSHIKIRRFGNNLFRSSGVPEGERPTLRSPLQRSTVSH